MIHPFWTRSAALELPRAFGKQACFSKALVLADTAPCRGVLRRHREVHPPVIEREGERADRRAAQLGALRVHAFSPPRP